MPERRPLALVGGVPTEMGAGDTVPISTWAPPADRRYAHLRSGDEEVYGDLYSPLARACCPASATLSARVITISGIVAPRSLRAAKVRFVVTVAGSHSDNPPVGARIWAGTDLKKLTVAATVRGLSADTFTTRGLKELDLSAAVTPRAGAYLFFQLYIGNPWKSQPALAGHVVSDALLNAGSGQVFEKYKAGQSEDQASPMDATSGWAAPVQATQPWWALA